MTKTNKTLYHKFYFEICAHLMCLGILGRLDSMDWDRPGQVLLSLAAAVEDHMGGTSGAVRT